MSVLILRVYLLLICAYHIISALATNFPLGWKECIASDLYSAKVNWDEPQFVYIIKPLGAFMFALGIMAAIAATNPIRNRAIGYGFATLFTLRGIQRIVFKDEIMNTFKISEDSNTRATAFQFGSAAAIIALYALADVEES